MMLAAALLMTATVLGQIDQTTYDKFDDSTRYRTHLARVEGEDSVHGFFLFYHHKGEGRVPARDSGEVHLMVGRSGKDGLYLKNHDVAMMQGRERFQISETRYDNEINSKYGKVHEFIQVSLTIEEIKKHLKTRTPWEIKIGVGDPLTIDPEALAKVAAFIEAIQKPE
jgi:hypothetical protein